MANDLPTSLCRTSRKFGALTYPEPLGPSRPVVEDLYLLHTQVMVDTKLICDTDHGTVPWHRQRPQFNARPFHVRVLVEKVAMP